MSLRSDYLEYINSTGQERIDKRETLFNVLSTMPDDVTPDYDSAFQADEHTTADIFDQYYLTGDPEKKKQYASQIKARLFGDNSSVYIEPKQTPIEEIEDPIVARELGVVEGALKGFAVGMFDTAGSFFTSLSAITPTEVPYLDEGLRNAGKAISEMTSDQMRADVALTQANPAIPFFKEGREWYELDKGDIPKAIRSWGAQIGVQGALHLYSRMFGQAFAKLGAKIGASSAFGAGKAGPQAGTPEEAVTVPAGAIVGYWLGSTFTMSAVETASMIDELETYGLPRDKIDKYARAYGFFSGMIEGTQQMGRGGKHVLKKSGLLKEKLEKPAQRYLISKIGKKLTDMSIDGLEELSQGELMQFFVKKAINEAKAEDPNFKPTREFNERTTQARVNEFAMGSLMKATFDTAHYTHGRLLGLADQETISTTAKMLSRVHGTGAVITKTDADDITTSLITAFNDPEQNKRRLGKKSELVKGSILAEAINSGDDNFRMYADLKKQYDIDKENGGEKYAFEELQRHVMRINGRVVASNENEYKALQEYEKQEKIQRETINGMNILYADPEVANAETETGIKLSDHYGFTEKVDSISKLAEDSFEFTEAEINDKEFIATMFSESNKFHKDMPKKIQNLLRPFLQRGGKIIKAQNRVAVVDKPTLQGAGLSVDDASFKKKIDGKDMYYVFPQAFTRVENGTPTLRLTSQANVSTITEGLITLHMNPANIAMISAKSGYGETKLTAKRLADTTSSISMKIRDGLKQIASRDTSDALSEMRKEEVNLSEVQDLIDAEVSNMTNEVQSYLRDNKNVIEHDRISSEIGKIANMDVDDINTAETKLGAIHKLLHSIGRLDPATEAKRLLELQDHQLLAKAFMTDRLGMNANYSQDVADLMKVDDSVVTDVSNLMGFNLWHAVSTDDMGGKRKGARVDGIELRKEDQLALDEKRQAIDSVEKRYGTPENVQVRMDQIEQQMNQLPMSDRVGARGEQLASEYRMLDDYMKQKDVAIAQQSPQEFLGREQIALSIKEDQDGQGQENFTGRYRTDDEGRITGWESRSLYDITAESGKYLEEIKGFTNEAGVSYTEELLGKEIADALEVDEAVIATPDFARMHSIIQNTEIRGVVPVKSLGVDVHGAYIAELGLIVVPTDTGLKPHVFYHEVFHGMADESNPNSPLVKEINALVDTESPAFIAHQNTIRNDYTERFGKDVADRYMARMGKEEYLADIFGGEIKIDGFKDNDYATQLLRKLNDIATAPPAVDIDTEYMRAYEADDQPAMQALVDQRAKAQGYNTDEVMYHGTTHDFTTFTDERGNPENHHGIGHYFTNTEYDALQNYSHEGGTDLTSRIERRAQQIEAEEEIAYEEAKLKAKNELAGKETRIVEAYLKTDNPVRIGGTNETYFEPLEILDMEAVEELKPEALEALIEDGNEEPSEADIEEKARELAEENGYYNEDVHPVLEAVQNISWFYDTNEEGLVEIEQLLMDGASASDIDKALREYFQDAQDDDGNFVVGEAVRQVYQELGFDSIIDATVSEKFSNMGIGQGTVHTIVFDSRQIKERAVWTEDNNGNVIPLSQRFQADDPDIRFSVRHVEDTFEHNAWTVTRDSKLTPKKFFEQSGKPEQSASLVFDEHISKIRQAILMGEAVNAEAVEQYGVSVPVSWIKDNGLYKPTKVTQVIEDKRHAIVYAQMRELKQYDPIPNYGVAELGAMGLHNIFKTMQRKKRAELNKVYAQTKRWKRNVDAEVLRAIPYYIEGTEWTPDIAQYHEKSVREIMENPEAKAIAEEAKALLEKLRTELNIETETMTGEEWIKFFENYVPHLYKRRYKKSNVMPYKYKTSSPSVQQRVFSTYAEAEENGYYVQDNMDIGKMINVYAMLNWNVVTNKKFLNNITQLKTIDGDMMVVPVYSSKKATQGNMTQVEAENIFSQMSDKYRGKGLGGKLASKMFDDAGKLAEKFNGKTAGYVWMDSPYLDYAGFWVHPDAKNVMKKAIDKPYDSKWIDRLNRFITWSKYTALAFSAFHPFSLLESMSSASGYNDAFKSIFGKKLQKLGIKDTAILQDVLDKAIDDPEFGSWWINQGLMVTLADPNIDSSLIDQDIQRIIEWANETKTPHARLLAGGAKVIQAYKSKVDNYLWNYMHPAMKLHTAQKLLMQYQDQADKLGEPFDKETAGKQIAQYVNNAFGGQEWDAYEFATPKAKQVWHMIMFAPDWTLSNLQISGLPVLLDGVGIRGLSQVKGAIEIKEMAHNYWRRMAITLSLFPAIVQASIYGLTSPWREPEDEDEMFSWNNEYGQELSVDITPIHRAMARSDIPAIAFLGRTFLGETGKQRYYIKWGKQAREVKRWVEHPFESFFSKTSMAVKLAFEQITGSRSLDGTYGTEWRNENINFIESIPLRAMGIGGKFMPLSIKTLASGKPSSFFAPIQTGMTSYKGSKMLEQVFDAYARPSIWNGIKDNPDYVRKLDDLAPQIIEALEKNGYDPQVAIKQAKRNVTSEYYGKYWDALNKNKEKDLEEIAEGIVRMHALSAGIISAMEYRQSEAQPYNQQKRELAQKHYRKALNEIRLPVLTQEDKNKLEQLRKIYGGSRYGEEYIRTIYKRFDRGNSGSQ